MSNLLEKASILLTPTAYDDGKVLSVKPEDGTGDFDFTRNSSATRVNSQGLIEDVQILSGNLVSNGDFSQEGSEEVTNGDFATDSDWNLDSSCTIELGKANFLSSTSNSTLYQSSPYFTIGKTYKITYTVSNYSAGRINWNDFGAGAGNGINRTANGTYTDYYLKVGTTTNFGFQTNFGFTGSIDNVSVKEVGQDWTLGTGVTIGENKAIFTSTASGQSVSQNAVASSLTNGALAKVSFEVLSRTEGSFGVYFSGTLVGTLASAGVFTGYFTKGTETSFYIRALGTTSGSISNISVIEITDDTNLPRIDYSPYSGAGTCGHWLFEPQSTNLVYNSNDGFGSVNMNLVYNNATSPDGTQNAYKSTTTAASGAHVRTLNVIFAATSAFSVFLKYGNNQWYQIISAGKTGNFVNVDIQNGVFGTSGADTENLSIKDFGNGWYRVSGTFINAAATSTLRVYAGSSSSSNWAAASAPIGSYNYGYGFQVEAQSFATSYIPTSGSTVTRLKDAAFDSGSSDLINSTEGVLYAEIAKLQDINDNYRLISMTNNASNSANNSVTIGFSNSNKFYFRIAVNGVSILSSTSILAATKNQYYKVAIKFNALGDNAVWIDGIEVLSNTTSFTYPIIMDKLSFNYNGNGGLPFYGKTKCLAVFKEALTDEELTCLTTDAELEFLTTDETSHSSSTALAPEAVSYYYYSGDGSGQSNLELNNEGLPILDDSNIKAAVNAYLNGELDDIELWDVSNVTNMNGLFKETSFNSDISNWDVSNVTNMAGMFFATSFNQPIGDWDVSNVTNMGSMFFSAAAFNQPIGDWDTSSLISVPFMFYGSTSFNQPIGNWDVTNFNSEYNGYFMGGVTLSTSNYDNLLIGWAAQMLIEYPGGSGYTIAPSWRFGNSVHTIGGDAESAKNTLINTFNWTITDAN